MVAQISSHKPKATRSREPYSNEIANGDKSDDKELED